MSKIEDSLSEIIKTAKSIDLAEDNLIEVIKILYQEV